MNKWIKYTILSMLILFLFSNHINIDAKNETPNSQEKHINELYQRAIEQGKVSKEKYSFFAFKENYLDNKTTYNAMKKSIGTDLDYDNWFDTVMNYAAFPDGEGHSKSETHVLTRSSNSARGNRLKNDIRKGDIILVSTPGFGHAAIANTDNYILEMSGGSNFLDFAILGISDNNHQFSKTNWIFGSNTKEQGVKPSNHIKYTIQLWRIPNKNMANKCADYADKMFWSSTHKYKKDRHITYRITSSTLRLNPNYCSKMIFQAYYNGSGTAPVIKSEMATLTFIAPFALPNMFTSKYAPYKVGTY